MTWRRWHRWVGLPAGLFLLFIAVTGVLLHLDMMRLGQQPPGHGEPVAPRVHPIPDDAALAAMIARLADRLRDNPQFQAHSLAIDLTGDRITLVAGAGGGPGAPGIKLDALSGQAIIVPPPPADFHYVLQDLHAGYFLGWPGRLLSIACGLSLVVLAVSGIKLWWDMARRKGRAFWK